jgi:peptidoglycan/LPS O-acetylase OafA/YrhL
MKQESRFTEIDLLRFLAALAVMFLHYGIRGFAVDDRLSPLHFPVLGPLVKYNYLGVNLFFMISGFVILMTVQSKDVRGFFISRVVRLYPAYWVSCTLTFLVILLFARDQIYTSLSRYVANMTMLNGFFDIGGIDGVYWTLCVELKFYLLVGILLALKQIPRIDKYLGAWLLVSILHLQYPNPVLSYVFIPQYSAYFVAGAVFYLVHKEGFNRYRAFLLLASFVVALMNDIPVLLDKSLWYRMTFDIPWLVGIIGVFYLVFLAISTRKSSVSRWDPLFIYLGTLSYPLYLLHSKIGMAIFWNLDQYVNPHVLLIGTMVLMLCMARLIHVQVEKRFSPALKRLLERVLRSKKSVRGKDGLENHPGSAVIEMRADGNRGVTP